MKTYIWTAFFWGIFLFFLSSSMQPSPKIASVILPAQNKNINLVDITPTCLDRSDIPAAEIHWLYMPQDPSELATNEYYGFLSGQLISQGVVNASDCPQNGLWPNGYANSCGLEKTHEVSVKLQNVYDNEILAAGKGIGVPPVMIKQLIRYESQFWPGQMGLYHFGLGHITYMGASNALIWNRSLFEDAYTDLLLANQTGTTNWTRQLLSMMDATCSTCPLKIDVPKAEQSIAYIAKVLMAYCRQTSQVIFNATKKSSGQVVDYATIWKLTLLNYNVGPNCVYNAVNETYQYYAGSSTDNTGSTDDTEATPTPEPTPKLNWDEIAGNITDKSCKRGIPYVDNITREYYDFGTNP